MNLLKKLILASALYATLSSKAQVRFSFATDVSALRNFSPKQKFWAVGQTIQANFHLNKKETFYAWLVYYSPGRFENVFRAYAIQPGTNPASVAYRMKGLWKVKEFSLGLKHYFKGDFKRETGWNLYGLAGLGLMFTDVKNTLNSPVDTSKYRLDAVPVEGIASFKRLTLDLGLGAEVPLGGDFFIYSDIKTFMQASSFPSPYLHRNKNVPLPLMANLGVRILFGFSY